MTKNAITPTRPGRPNDCRRCTPEHPCNLHGIECPKCHALRNLERDFRPGRFFGAGCRPCRTAAERGRMTRVRAQREAEQATAAKVGRRELCRNGIHPIRDERDTFIHSDGKPRCRWCNLRRYESRKGSRCWVCSTPGRFPGYQCPRCTAEFDLLDALYRAIAKERQALLPDCPQGHPYAGDNLNLYIETSPRPRFVRECRTCHTEKQARLRAKARARMALGGRQDAPTPLTALPGRPSETTLPRAA